MGRGEVDNARFAEARAPPRPPRARASSGGGRGTGASGDAHDADKTAFTILARNSPGVLQVRAASRPPVLIFERGRDQNISRVPEPTATAPPPIPDADDIVRGRRRRLQHRIAQRRHAPHRRLPVVRHHGRRAAHATRVLHRPRPERRRSSSWPDYDFMSDVAVMHAGPTAEEREAELIADLRSLPSVRDVEIVHHIGEAELSAKRAHGRATMWRRFFGSEDEAHAGIKTMVEKDSLDEGDAFEPRNEAPEDRNDGHRSRHPRRRLLYLVHDFASYPSWDFATHYDALARDPTSPTSASVGSGRTGKYRYFFPSPSTNVAAIATNFRDDLRMKAFSGQIEEFDPGAVVTHGGSVMGAVVEVPDPKFNQPSKYKFSGRKDNVEAASDDYYEHAKKGRKFNRVTPAMASEPAFNEIVHRFCNYVRMDPRFARRPFLDVGVHVIRIKSDESVPDMRGQVVPEGMHQDGFDQRWGAPTRST